MTTNEDHWGPAEILRRARQRLTDIGWTQGVGAKYDSDHFDAWGRVRTSAKPISFCSVGAINEEESLGVTRAINTLRQGIILTDPEFPLIEERTRLHPEDEEYFRLYGPTGKWVSVVDWNDAEGRTKEQVLAAFDRAIQLAEENS